MKKPGYIRIIVNELIFEYYELEKPDQNTYSRRRGKNINDITWESEYQKALEDYEASKRSVKIENNFKFIKRSGTIYLLVKNEWRLFGDNQPCEAEVTGKTATIINLK